MAVPDLAYVALAVESPEHSAGFFNRELGLPRHELADEPEVPFVTVGETALAFFRLDDPRLGGDARKGVHHVAMTAETPREAADALGEGQIGHTSTLAGRCSVALPRSAACGVAVRFIEPLGLPPGSSAAVTRIDHLGVASSDNSAALDTFVTRLGCRYESRQTDSEFETVSENFTSTHYPNVFHSRHTQLRGSLNVLFITLGDCELEFLQDLTIDVNADEARHDVAGNTRGDRSAIARYVHQRGAGLHHLALKTPDIDRTLAELHAAGHRVIDHVGRPGSRRARIGFVHPSATGGVLLHFVEREELPG